MTIHTSDNWHYNVNETYATHGDAYVAWVNVLLAAGWTCIASYDGSTINSATPNNVAAWNSNNAWTHLRDPGGASGRDLVIQRSTSAQNTAVYLGKAGEAFGAGSGATAPTAAGRFQLVGTGGSPQSNWFGTGTISNFYFHFAAKAVAAGTSGDVYQLWVAVRPTNSTSGDQGSLVVGALSTPADGVVGDADSEPWFSHSASSSLSSLRGWYKAGLTGELQDTGLTGLELSNWSGINPYSGLDDYSPVLVYSTTGGREQRKGLAEEFFADCSIRGQLQVLSPTVEGSSRLNIGAWSYPWPHNVPVRI